MHIILSVLIQTWNIIEMSAFYIIFGFFIAGLLYIYIKPEKIKKYFGSKKISSVIYISLIGIPIPLCSCGVVPTAISFKRQGASTGATLSFLISTPESGVDSIAITYALMDPVMTFARPVCAFITATIAGILQNFLDTSEHKPADGKEDTCKVCEANCCSSMENVSFDKCSENHSFFEKIKAGLKYSFLDLMGDVSCWLIFGLTLAGLISVLIPAELIEGYLGSGFFSMLIMLVIGIPVYICASASTPIAAALVAKGASPGAALVFLLAGPATNIASIVVLTKFLGKRAVIIYLLTICICSLFLGWILNYFYLFFKIPPRALTGSVKEIFPEWFNVLFGLLFLAIVLYNWILILAKKHKKQ